MSIGLKFNRLRKRLALQLTHTLSRMAFLRVKPKRKTILVFRSAALGDFIISLPALKLLRTFYPEHKIILITIQSSSKEQREKVSRYTGSASKFPWIDLATPHLVDETIVISSLEFGVLWKEVRPLVLEISPEACFMLTDPSSPGKGVLKKLLLLRLLGVKSSIYGWRDMSTTSRMREEQYLLGNYNHHVLGPIRAVLESPATEGKDTIKVEFDVRIPDSNLIFSEKIWNEYNLFNKKVITIAPGSIQPHKRWPIEKFKEVCQYLLKQPDTSMIITGTPGDQKLGDELREIDPIRIINLVGKTSVGELAAVLKRSDLLIGNDGGTMHLGDAVGCRVVSIVPGIEYPDSIEPWHNIRYSVRHSVPCAPCYNFVSCPKGHNKCMTELDTREVLSSIKDAIEFETINREKMYSPRKFRIIRDKLNINLIEVK